MANNALGRNFLNVLFVRAEELLYRLLSILAVSTVFGTLALSSTPASAITLTPQVQLGLTWLKSQANADGSISGESGAIAYPGQTRAEAARTLQALDGAVPPALLTVLQPAATDSAEVLARKALALRDAGQDVTATLAQISSLQNSDGGFGTLTGYMSNPVDTAFAAQALALGGSTYQATASKALSWLSGKASSPGAFGINGEDAIYVSAQVALGATAWSTRLSTTTITQPISTWLLAQRNAATQSYKNTFQNAHALLALMNLTSNQTVLQTLSSIIVSAQSPDGSWGQDPYVTAVALRALFLADQPPPAATSGDVRGVVVDAATKQPLTGVTVQIKEATSFTTGSNAAGVFQLSAIPQGSYTLYVVKLGYQAQEIPVTITAGMSLDVGTIALSPTTYTATLSGVIKNASGTVLSGVIVSVGTSSATTDAQGAYTLTNLAPGSGIVRVQKSGYQTATATIDFQAGQSYVFSPVLLANGVVVPTTATLRGTVVDAVTLAVLPNAQITLNGASTVSTNASGAFEITGLVPGAFKFTVTAAGYQGALVSGVTVAGVNDVSKIALTPQPASQTASLSGVVRNVSGAALSGVVVEVVGTGRKATTSATGEYSINNLAPGAVTITATKSGYQTASANVTFDAGKSYIFSPAMVVTGGATPTTATVQGVVQNASTSTPIAGANVVITASGNPTVTVTTDATGKYTATGLPAGSFTISVTATGYQAFNASGSLALGVNDAGTIKLQPLPAASTISGVVVDGMTQAPIAGAQVVVQGPATTVTTNSAGEYTLTDVVGPQVTLKATASGYLSQTSVVSVAAGAVTTLNFTLYQPTATGVSIVSAATSKASYLPKDEIQLNAQILNSGSQATSLVVRVLMLDASGQVVREIKANPVGLGNDPPNMPLVFESGQTLSREIGWGISRQAAGQYTALLQVIDGSGRVVAEAPANFNVSSAAILTGGVAANPPLTQVGTNQPIVLSADVANSGNVSLPTGSLNVNVVMESPDTSTNLTPQVKAAAPICYAPPVSAPKSLVSKPGGGQYTLSSDGSIYTLDGAGTATLLVKLAACSYGVMSSAVDASGNLLVGCGTSVRQVSAAGVVTTLATSVSPISQIATVEWGNQGEAFVGGTGNNFSGLVKLLGGQQTVLWQNGLAGPTAMVKASTGEYVVTNNVDDTLSKVDPQTGAVSTFVSGLNRPTGITQDSAGNYYVANTGDNTIVRVQADGTATVFATGLNQPYDLKFDTSGSTLYVTNTGDGTIVKVNSQGQVQPFVRSIANGPQGMRYDTAGNLWITNNDGTLRVSKPDGSVDVVATGLSSPRGLAIDSAGTAYVANYSNGTVQKISGGQASNFATGLSGPWGVAIDGSGTIWVSEYNASRLKGFDAAGNVVATVDSLLKSPRQVRVGTSGEVFVLDGAGFVTVMDATGPRILFRDSTVALTDIVVDPSSGQLLAKSSVNKLYRINPSTGAATQFSTLTAGKSWYGIAADMAGNAYSIDYSARVLNKIDSAGVVTAFSAQFPNYATYLSSALDGRPTVYYNSTNYYQFAADGSVVANTLAAPDGNYVYRTTLASDGSLLAATYGKTFRLNASTGALLQTYNVSTYNLPDLTADGSGTLFGVDQGQDQLLQAAPVANSMTAVLSGITSPQDLAWSGTELRFVGGSSHLYHYTPGGAYPERYAGTQSNSGFLDVVGADTYYATGNTAYKFSSGTQSTFATGISVNTGVASGGGLVAVANTNYSTVTVLGSNGAVTQRNAGLVSPRGLVFDALGQLWVSSWGTNVLGRVDLANGNVLPVLTVSQPDFLALGADGDIYVSSGYTIYKANSTGSLSVAVSNVHADGLTMYPRGLLWDGSKLVAADSASSVLFSSSTPQTATSWVVQAVGLSKPSAMAVAADGTLYVGSQNNHTVLRYASNQLQPYAGGFGTINTLAIEPGGDLLVGQNSGDISRVAAGTRTVTDVAVSNLLNNYNVTGLTSLGSNHFQALTTTNACVTDISVSQPVTPPAAGTVVYQTQIPMSELPTSGDYSTLALGQWLPQAGGDYKVEVSRPGYESVLTNFVHVGPAASSTLQAMLPQLKVTDTQLPMCMKLSGADFTSISRPELGLMKPVAKSPAPKGMTVDRAGNIYTTDSSNLYKIDASGVRTTLVSGLSFPFGLTIDDQEYLYAPVRGAGSTYDLVRFDRQGNRTVIANLGITSANGVQVDSQGNVLVGSPGKLLKVTQQGQVSTVTTSGLPDPRGIAIDGKDNVYVQNEADQVTMIAPDGTSKQVYWKRDGVEHPLFEGDGYPNIAADCADNFYIAPYAWSKINQAGEEHSIAQVIPRTGQVALLVDVTKVDPSLTDIDYLAYDRLNSRLLAWDDYSTTIWQVPMTCGAISVDVHLLAKQGQSLSGATVPPAAQVPLPDGRTEYVWSLKDVPASGAQVCFDASQSGLTLGQLQKSLDSGFMSFKNSFAANNVTVPINIPSVLVANEVNLGIATDKPSYGPGETATITSTLNNTNTQAVNGVLTVEVLDAQGMRVGQVLLQSVSLAAGEVLPVAGDFGIGTLLTGTYTARATIIDAGTGNPVALATTNFDVVPKLSITTTLGLDRSVYNPTDRVLMHSTAQNTSANYVYSQLTLRLRVADAASSLVFEKAWALSQLTPGQTTPLDTVQPLLVALAGKYTVTQELLDAQGAVLDTKTAAYTVNDTNANGFGLLGKISATPQAVLPGYAVALSADVSNGGNADLPNLPVTVYVIDPAQGTAIEKYTETLANVVKGQTSPLSAMSWDSTQATVGATYLAVLVANVGGVERTLAQTSFTVVGAITPVEPDTPASLQPIPTLGNANLLALTALLGLVAAFSARTRRARAAGGARATTTTQNVRV